MFDERAQLAERLVVFRNQEERIIPEAPRAAFLTRHAPAADSLGLETDRSRRISQRECAAECRAPAFVGNIGERFENLAIIGLIILGLTRVTRRVDARRAAKCVDGKPRVVGEDPF